MTSKNTGKSTCSPASAASASDSEWQAGLTIDLFSQADSPASPGVSPGSSEAQKMTVTSGQKWQDLLRQCGLDGCLAKTFRALLENRWASTECFLTWNVSATPQGRQVFRLVPSMPRTGAPESGLWDTPHAPRKNDSQFSNSTYLARTVEKVLYDEAALWPTPDASAGSGGRVSSDPAARIRPSGTKKAMTINEAAQMAAEYEAAKMWATPAARDHKGATKESRLERTGSKAGEALDAQVGQTTPPSEGGALNPEFVCWLMGYPSEWLNCAPSAMPSSRKSSRKSPAQ
jgi:hypothetical protein